MKKIILSLALIFVTAFVSGQTVIQMTKVGGTYMMPCTVNGLKLNFIFDSGAADVCISLTEAQFMLKNGYLEEKDILSTSKYSIANGDIVEGTKINLKILEIGGVKLYNISASIIHTATAPLLLGQTALERFGKFSFDYSNNTLILGEGSVENQSKQELIYEGQTYKTVKIGNQIWMAENLNFVTKESWCYDGNPDNCKKYGCLYTWNSAKNACPSGWHLPSKEDWEIMFDYVGGTLEAGNKLKSISSWKTPNKDSKNSWGFNALPGGHRNTAGFSNFKGESGYWWTSTEQDANNAISFDMGYNHSNVFPSSNSKKNGFSVRCIKD